MTVEIINWHYLKQKREMAVTVMMETRELILGEYFPDDSIFSWGLKPNLASDTSYGGFSLNWSRLIQCNVYEPDIDETIRCDHVYPNPKHLCWIFKKAGEEDGHQLWRISNYNGSRSIEPNINGGNPIHLFLRDINETDKQRWVIRKST